MHVIDATFLLLFLDESTPAPLNPATEQRVSNCKERIRFSIAELSRQKVKPIIPTPALSEALIHAGSAAPKYLEIMRASRYFQISSFDTRAAVETAALLEARLKSFGSLRGDEADSRAKIKFDRQILAFARVNNASLIYTDTIEACKSLPRIMA